MFRAPRREPKGTIAQWVRYQRGQSRSNNTINHRTRILCKLEDFLDHPPETASYDELVDYLASFPASTKPGTKATYHSAIKAYFRWLTVQAQLREDDPMGRIQPSSVPRRQPRPVTPTELRAILNVTVRRRTRMMVLLAALQGLRCFEIAKIRGEDVNVHDLRLRVVGKGGVDATIALHSDVAEFMFEGHFPTRGFWFPSYIGNRDHPGEPGPILAKSVSHELSQVFSRAGVSGGAHRLRHWHATDLLQQGTDVRVVQTMLRHASLSTTALYTRVDPSLQAEAITRVKLPTRESAGGGGSVSESAA